MSQDAAETARLLERARKGEREALDLLFRRHEEPLRRAIAWRLDPRVAARVDVSDVFQETCLEAVRRLPEKAGDPDLPFHLWLRWIAREKVGQIHRRHLGAGKRAVGREVPALPMDSSVLLVRSLAGGGPTPSQAASAAELSERLRRALQGLDEDERELILWRHFEQLTIREAARLLGIGEAAASKRYLRALDRLQGLLHALGVTSAG